MEDRVRLLKSGHEGNGDVIYWMNRDQRLHDNYALFFAQHLADSKQRHLRIVFLHDKNAYGNSIRHHYFMLEGLKELAQNCKYYNISFEFLNGSSSEEIANNARLSNAYAIVTDFMPLRYHISEKAKLINSIDIPIYEVDAHNVVPVWVASQKLEFAAYTIRPKIHKLLPKYLIEIPEPEIHKYGNATVNGIEYKPVEFSQFPFVSKYYIPGEKQAIRNLRNFISERLGNYAENRNEPALSYQSGLSPYLHFGQISAQRIALEVSKANAKQESKDVLLEELIVRKELSDNFCYYCPDYDSFGGFPEWAQKTLNEHRNSPRDYIYNFEQFERAATHDKYWNAAQLEMVITGKMHGYMRMYWAKKILEWTRTPEEALDFATILNDKYELDGTDPNGHTGIAWSIGGVHDRPWTERPVYGKIRYMNESGLKRKFDIDKYVEKINKLKNESNYNNNPDTLFDGV